MSNNLFRDDEKIMLLQSHFRCNGALLCNDNKELPSLGTIGGDWNGIIALIEQGDVFYSKLYKGRVTYLSRDFYYLVKQYKQRGERLSGKSLEILKFLEAVGPVNSKTIKETFTLPAKTFTSCMDELFKELFVTAIQRDKTMNINWSSFLWGTFNLWEQKSPFTKTDQDTAKINMLLSSIMTDKQIQSLLK